MVHTVLREGTSSVPSCYKVAVRVSDPVGCPVYEGLCEAWEWVLGKGGPKEDEDMVPTSPWSEEEDIRVSAQCQLQNDVQMDHFLCPTLSSSVSE